MLSNLVNMYQHRGYCITGPVLSPVQQLRLRNKADSIQSDECVIFNNAESDNVNGPENDRKRRQASFTDRILASLVKKQVQACGLWSDQVHRVEQFVMVRSLPGCKQQWPHTDYNMDFRHGSLYNEYPAPLGAILALQDGTTLMVRGADGDMEKVGIPRGCMLLFHGGIVHAGSAYEEQNVRVHTFIGPHPGDKTYPAVAPERRLKRPRLSK